MKTASCKAKGRNLQYWVAHRVAKLFGITFVQSDDLCPIHSREMGQAGVDVYIRDKTLYDKFPYDIECKNTETVSLYQYIEQAKANTKDKRNWLVVHKKNRSKPIVIMDAEHFFNILKGTAEHIAWVDLDKRLLVQPAGNQSMNANIRREMDTSWEFAVAEENNS